MMMRNMQAKGLLYIVVGVCGGALLGQQASINTWITGQGGKPALAVPTFRATSGAEPLMDAFNTTLFSDLQNSGLFDMRACIR
jgi:hypothetical protein